LVDAKKRLTPCMLRYSSSIRVQWQIKHTHRRELLVMLLLRNNGDLVKEYMHAGNWFQITGRGPHAKRAESHKYRAMYTPCMFVSVYSVAEKEEDFQWVSWLECSLCTHEKWNSKSNEGLFRGMNIPLLNCNFSAGIISFCVHNPGIGRGFFLLLQMGNACVKSAPGDFKHIAHKNCEGM
jgi:hypothetical protein